jgi:hypothetical protein
MIHEWLVCFSGGPPHRWWRFVTRPGFRHVLIAGCDAEHRTWTFLDPDQRDISILSVPYGETAARILDGILAQCPNVLRYRPVRRDPPFPVTIGCVGAIKAVLGIRCGALGARGLYGELRRRGADVVSRPAQAAARPDARPGDHRAV